MGSKINRGARRFIVIAVSVVVFLACIVLFFPRTEINRIASHESQAVGHLREIARQETDFRQLNGCFTDTVGRLPGIVTEDPHYRYEMDSKTKNDQGCVIGYVIVASPKFLGKTATRYFSIDQTGTLRVQQMEPVTSNSEILQ